MKPVQIIDIINDSFAVAAGVSLPEHVLKAIVTHHALLQEWSGSVNLVGTRNTIEIAESLYLDSVVAAAFLGPILDGGGEIHDVGSGAGFPALFLPPYLNGNCTVVLHEARRRKASFLRAAARGMALTNVRVENEVVKPGGLRARAVLSRATFPPVEWLQLAASLIIPQGLVAAFLAGSEDPPMLDQKCSPALEPFARHEYTLPVTGKNRSIVVYRKTS